MVVITKVLHKLVLINVPKTLLLCDFSLFVFVHDFDNSHMSIEYLLVNLISDKRVSLDEVGPVLLSNEVAIARRKAFVNIP